MYRFLLLFLTALLLALQPLWRLAIADEAETWSELSDPEVGEVNEGALVFLEQPPAKPAHHHQHRLILGPTSLNDGWARVEQCHHHLDPVPLSQITFREGAVRNLKILHARHIGKAWIEDSSVQLEDIGKGASLCFQGELKVLFKTPGGGYKLQSGPFMRRFLDGYYPIRVSYEVRYQGTGLRLVQHSPPMQPGFPVRHDADFFAFDAWLEGELHVVLSFELLRSS